MSLAATADWRRPGSRTIMVVGGYGAVGAELCRALGRHEDLFVMVAGRQLERATSLAADLGRNAQGRHIDLADPSTWQAAIRGVDCVVVCMDQSNTRFPRFLFAHGVHYVDLTASDPFFRALEDEKPACSAALLSVGLAPGLTNLMAAHCMEHLDTADSVEIGLLFGLGDHHGRAGLAWMADRLFDPARPRGGRGFDYGLGLGRRSAHIVDFSDQHTLARTTGIRTASTRVALDSRVATALIFGVSSALAGRAWARDLLVSATGRVRIGSRNCHVSVHVHGQLNGAPTKASVHFAAQSESATTAALASVQIRNFLDAKPRPGVWHSHQVLDPTRSLEFAARIGALKLQLPVRGGA